MPSSDFSIFLLHNSPYFPMSLCSGALGYKRPYSHMGIQHDMTMLSDEFDSWSVLFVKEISLFFLGIEYLRTYHTIYAKWSVITNGALRLRHEQIAGQIMYFLTKFECFCLHIFSGTSNLCWVVKNSQGNCRRSALSRHSQWDNEAPSTSVCAAVQVLETPFRILGIESFQITFFVESG